MYYRIPSNIPSLMHFPSTITMSPRVRFYRTIVASRRFTCSAFEKHASLPSSNGHHISVGGNPYARNNNCGAAQINSYIATQLQCYTNTQINSYTAT